MKIKTCLKSFVLICSIVLVIIFSSSSCNVTPGIISAEREVALCKQVEKEPYVALIEGLQPFSGESMEVLGRKISSARKLSVCATSGNHDAHMPIIRKAHKNHQKIFIVGFSIGEAEAISLADDCAREGITVEKLFLLDGVLKEKVHASVRNVVDIVGTKRYMFRREGRYSKADVENANAHIKCYELDCDHLEVPALSYSILLAEL